MPNPWSQDTVIIVSCAKQEHVSLENIYHTGNHDYRTGTYAKLEAHILVYLSYLKMQVI